MKNILLISNSPVFNDININTLSLNNICEGSGRQGYMLYDYFSKNNNVYWISTELIKSLDIIKKAIEINYDINYDIVISINYSDESNNIISKLKQLYPNCKYIFIAENSYYGNETMININDTYDKVIFISKFGAIIDGNLIEDNKKIIIPNIVTFDKYENINYNVKQNNIIISYHFFKGNIDIFIKHIFPLIVKKIKDVKLVITTPLYINYDYDYGTIKKIIKDNSSKETINHIHFLGCLTQNELYKQYELAKVAWHYTKVIETFGYNVLDQLMFNIHPITSFDDSCAEFVTDEYIAKFKYNEKLTNYEFWANIIIDRILNYDKFSYIFDDVHNYIITKFNYNTVINKYNSIIYEN